MKVGYVRVSTTEQAETDALEQQTARIKKAGAVLVFSDVESGKSDKRSQLNKMMELCKKGTVSEVIITRVDRLARSVITIHKSLAFFEEKGIKLNILDAPIDDVSSPFGWFSASQMAQLAEFESRLLSSRIKHGMAYFREQKKAAPQPPFGYQRVNEKYAPNPETWDSAIALINFFLSPNATLRSTATYSLSTYNKKWTLPGLRYWMMNPVLRGHTAYNMRQNLNNPELWEIHQNTHPPMMTEETYRAIQHRLAENRHKFAYGVNKNPQESLPLQGQIICGCCGQKCFLLRHKWSTHRIRCKQHDTQGNDFCSNSKSTYLPDITKSVNEVLMQRIGEIAAFTAASQNHEKELPAIAELQKQLKSLRSLPKSPIIQSAITQTELEIERLKQEQVIKSTIDTDFVDKLISIFADKNYWETLPNSEKRQVYIELVESVTVANGEVLAIALRV